jgi:hypothetical protein
MRLIALLLAVAALAVAGCGGDDDETTASSTPTATATATRTAEPAQEDGASGELEAEGAGGKACSELADDLDGKPERRPPSDMDVLSYAHLYKSEGPFGRTQRFYAVLDGTPEDLPSRRDDASNELVQTWGFASLSTDQEEGAEAEARLEGAKHTVDIQVTPLCKGKIRIRYTVQ